MVNNWIDIIQNKLFPPSCILCGESGLQGLELCEDCFRELPVNDHCCQRCAMPLSRDISNTLLCGHCLAHTPYFEHSHAGFLYRGAMPYLITALKFGNHYQYARLLGLMLARQLKDRADLPDCLLPVPLYPQRYRERGFNQSIEIARVLSKELNIPLDLSSCRRVRNTRQQTRLSAKQRQANVRRCFVLRRPLKFKHIAIVDDVMTTGATLNELARLLQRQQCRVEAWVCARA